MDEIEKKYQEKKELKLPVNKKTKDPRIKLKKKTKQLRVFIKNMKIHFKSKRYL